MNQSVQQVREQDTPKDRARKINDLAINFDNRINALRAKLEAIEIELDTADDSFLSVKNGSLIPTHNILSPLHKDTTPNACVRGDLITGQGATPTWARLALGAPGEVLMATATDAAWTALPVFTGFANPTAQVGLAAVNGIATTAIRSDGAPALSQAIVPTWTGIHTFSNVTYSALFTGGNVGIKTALPDYDLDVAGSIGIDDYLHHNDDPNTYLYFSTDRINGYVGGKWLIDMNTVAAQDYVKIGDGTDVDINLNDDMFIEASTGYVSIGGITPNRLFTVGIDVDPFVSLNRSTIVWSANQIGASGCVQGEGGYISTVGGTNGGLLMRAFSKATATGKSSWSMVAFNENDLTSNPIFSFSAEKHDGAGGVTSHGATAIIFGISNYTTQYFKMLGNGSITVAGYGLGILHSSAGGVLTSSAIVNTDLGNVGTAGVHAKFAATGLADSLLSETADDVIIPTAKNFGLGAGKGRLTFTDDTIDTIVFNDCFAGINCVPTSLLTVKNTAAGVKKIFEAVDNTFGSVAYVNNYGDFYTTYSGISATFTGAFAAGVAGFGTISNNAFVLFTNSTERVRFSTGGIATFLKDIYIHADSTALKVGAADDAGIYYDGTNTVFGTFVGSANYIFDGYTTVDTDCSLIIGAGEAKDAILTFMCDEGDDTADKFRLRTVYNATSASNLFKIQCDNAVKDTFVDLMTVTTAGKIGVNCTPNANWGSVPSLIEMGQSILGYGVSLATVVSQGGLFFNCHVRSGNDRYRNVFAGAASWYPMYVGSYAASLEFSVGPIGADDVWSHGTNTTIKIEMDVTTGTVLNVNVGDFNTTINGTSATPAFFVDASQNCIGVGTTAPLLNVGTAAGDFYASAAQSFGVHIKGRGTNGDIAYLILEGTGYGANGSSVGGARFVMADVTGMAQIMYQDVGLYFSHLNADTTNLLTQLILSQIGAYVAIYPTAAEQWGFHSNAINGEIVGTIKQVTDMIVLHNDVHNYDMDGTGVGIRFDLSSVDGVSTIDSGRISCYCEQDLSTGANEDTALAFATSLNGTLANKVFIKSDGILNLTNTPDYANDAAAKAGGLVNGDVYRNGDVLMVCHA